MTIVLTVFLIMSGVDKPNISRMEMPDIATCQEEAGHFLKREIPEEFKAKIEMMGAGCAVVFTGQDVRSSR